jgi:hypothetical protein
MRAGNFARAVWLLRGSIMAGIGIAHRHWRSLLRLVIIVIGNGVQVPEKRGAALSSFLMMIANGR